jgi:hypothetical protein
MRQSSHLTLIKQGLLILILIVVALMITPRSLLAQAINRGDRVFSGQVIDNDVIMYGDDVILAGTVLGNAFITGRDITIDGNIEGSLFAIGQRITINGTVGGSGYLAALSARLGPSGNINQNLYFVGVSIATDNTSQVGRDLNGVSLGAYLQGDVGRNTNLIAGLVQLLGMFMDTALGPTPAPLQIADLSGRAPGLGQFILPGNIYIDLIGQTTDPSQTDPETATHAVLVSEWFRLRLRDLLPLLIVSLIGYWFLRRPLEATARAVRTRPLPALGIGLIGLVLSAAVIGAFILVFIFILLIGIWLGTINLWNVTWLLWSVAFPLTALTLSLFMIFLNYGTKAILVYAVATYLINRFAPQSARFQWVWFILGLVIYILLQAIPLLGWVIAILVTAWGLGAAWLAWRGRRANVPEAVVPVASPPEMSEAAVPVVTKSNE